MYTVYLATVLGILIMLVKDRLTLSPESRTVDSYVWGASIGAVFGLLLGVLFAATVMNSMVPRHDVVSATVRLVPLRTSEGPTGTFIWNNGSILREATYRFLYLNADGSMSPGNVAADSSVRIIEDKDIHGVGYWRTISKEADRSSPMALWALGPQEGSHVVAQEFRVPVGAVVQNFSTN